VKHFYGIAGIGEHAGGGEGWHVSKRLSGLGHQGGIPDFDNFSMPIVLAKLAALK